MDHFLGRDIFQFPKLKLNLKGQNQKEFWKSNHPGPSATSGPHPNPSFQEGGSSLPIVK